METHPKVSDYPAGSPVQIAVEIATAAHEGQRDKIKQPYILHPLAVAEYVAADGHDEATIIAAVLHDVFEDTKVLPDEAISRGIPREAVDIALAVSRAKGQVDDEYYEQVIAGGPKAIAVKRADIRHNTDPVRTAQLPTDEREHLAKKYKHADALMSAAQEG